MVTDIGGRIVEVNPSFCRMMGYARAELLDRTSDMLHAPQHDAAFFARIRESLDKTGQWEGEIWNRRRNGDIRQDHLSIHAYRPDAGELMGYVSFYGDLPASRLASEQLELVGHFDALTGLAKHKPLTDHLHQACEQARQENWLLAVICLDLDGFKLVNDHYGRATGDLLLVRVAQHLRQTAPEHASVARLGGDEFALVIGNLPNMDEVDSLANRIMTVTEAPCEIEGRELALSASLGVTVFPFDNADPETLLRHASQAMFQAKQSGRKRVHLFDAEQDQLDISRVQALARLHQALENQEFELHYQPKVNMRSGRVVGVEALIRWRHPERGLLPPGEFLPLVEADDLIIDIGKWVLHTALARLEIWAQAGLDLSVSVNIAARQLQQDDFIDLLHQALIDHPGVPDGRLELEILESAALENTAHVRDVINTCQRLGVGFALDDFGTGYASLSYLRDIPADVLKIDQRFVRNILEEGDDLTLVDGVISLANAFRRIVVAEGVETAEQGVLLLRLGCDIAQGYGIARPMPAEAVADWIATYQPDPQWRLWADTPWEMVDFPLLVARYDHVKWVKQITLYVEGAALHLADHEIVDHHQCRFGRWYYGHGESRYGGFQAFKDLEGIHAEVHRLGPEIVGLRAAGHMEQARARLDDLLSLKDRILEGLARLQETVAARGATPLAGAAHP